MNVPRRRLHPTKILTQCIAAAAMATAVTTLGGCAGGARPLPSSTTSPAPEVSESRASSTIATPSLTQSTGTPPAHSLGDTRVRRADNATMVFVPGGEFRMGSTDAEMQYASELREQYIRGCQCAMRWVDDEQPVHTVALAPFWLDRTEVTNRQYSRCVDAGVCDPPDQGEDGTFGDDAQPVVGVSWHDAVDYCEWIGDRLPTEAEWEYAARGPERNVYPWGETFDDTRLNYCSQGCDREWADLSAADGHALTAPVGSYPGGASWCGALDMAGNAWEWVADSYGRYPAGRQENPTGPDAGAFRVLRGGSWSNLPYFLRGAVRNWTSPLRRDMDIGFRCAADDR